MEGWWVDGWWVNRKKEGRQGGRMVGGWRVRWKDGGWMDGWGGESVNGWKALK